MSPEAVTERRAAAPAPRGTRAGAAATEDPRIVALALVGLLALAALLRFREAGRTLLWTDEIMTLWMARGSLGDTLGLVGRDIHPPLHFLLVKAWRAIGGEGGLWLKSLSVLFGVTLVGATIGAGRALFGRTAAWIAGALLAVHAGHVYVSQESRFYALLWLWILGAAWMAWRWIARRRAWDAAGLVAFATLGIYTHYLAGLVFAFLGLWGLVVTWRRDPSQAVAWIGLFAAVGVLFVPQVPTFLRQLAQNAQLHWLTAPSPRNLLELSRQVSFMALYLVPPVGILALVPLFRRETRLAASLLWTLAAGPVLTAYAITVAGGHLYADRYMQYIVPLVLLLAAAGIASIPARALRLAVFGLLFFAGLRVTLKRQPFREAQDQQAAAEWLATQAAPSDTIYHADIHGLFFFMHHYPGMGTHRLVWWLPRVPYFEGGTLIQESWIVRGEGFGRVAASGRWWGTHTTNGGTDASRTRSDFDALGARAGPALERVTLWRGPAAEPVAPARALVHPRVSRR